MWHIEKLEINGGFLPSLQLSLPSGLTCIIGPRGSGKSTLAEIIRFALRGSTNASKSRQDLLQSNLGPSGLITIAACVDKRASYTLRRAFKQSAVLLSSDGKPVAGVEVDRGSFLPLDAYTGPEIEAIADETLGEKRRALLDELREDDLRAIKLAVSEQRRSLQANAEQIRATQALISDSKEQIEELGDAQAQLTGLGPAPDTESDWNITVAARQEQCNKREIQRNETAKSRFVRISEQIKSLTEALASKGAYRIVEPGSANEQHLMPYQDQIDQRTIAALVSIAELDRLITESLGIVDKARISLQPLHSEQAALHSMLQKENSAASELIRRRTDLEQKISRLAALRQNQIALEAELKLLQDRRKQIKGDFLASRDKISNIRDLVGQGLQSEAGTNIQIRVLRNADNLAYQTMLLDGLRGGRVRGHEDILSTLLRLRPEQLAQLVEANDAKALEELTDFGEDRSRRIIDAFRANLDPFELEIVEIEDRIKIELNVSTSRDSNFKDAAELSRGQKCTALLPILLARRQSPLIIDQPEDNLDNHFIYETVVNTIRRLKSKRQMVFITHNANIPVLAEADLIVVLNSDGKIGFIEKQGTVDQCRDSIVDLLEGGEEAFELRRKRYGRL
ncbi:MAG: hypothetical protein JWM83_2686 [Candidatus Angelobacter sp.]|nr:hypothetical protein [Candidatus Angelobacter sp.]